MGDDFLTVVPVDTRWAILLVRSWTWPAIRGIFDTEQEAREALKTMTPPVWVGR